MNRTWWGIPNYTVLEKVAHALHMAEAWENAMGEYKMIERLLDPKSDLCSCVTGTRAPSRAGKSCIAIKMFPILTIEAL